MLNEHDHAEVPQNTEHVDHAQLNANDAARRRVLEYDGSLLDCEHTGNPEEGPAVDRSARIMDQWEQSKDPEARRKLLEGVGREMMNVHEAPPAPVNAKSMAEGDLGAHDDRAFLTDLNREQLKQDNPEGALDTYLHEYRHVEQHYEAQKSHGALAHDANGERAPAMEYNLNHYIDGHKDFDAYKRQLVEADARRFASTTAGEILERRQELHQEYPGWGDEPASGADRIARTRLIAEGKPRS